MTQPGLSVWMWGPIMWSVFHTVAYQCDKFGNKAFDPAIIANFFRYVQCLLPCKYCRDSYGDVKKGFLVDVQKERNETLEEAFSNKHMVSLIYDLHNKVNYKLAKQRWQEVVGVLKSKFMDNPQALEVLACTNLEKEAVMLLDKHPTILTVYKRNDFYLREPVNIEGLMLLTIHLCKRILELPDEEYKSKIWNFILFLSVVQKMLTLIPDHQAKLLALNLETACTKTMKEAKGDLSKGSSLESLHQAFYNYTTPINLTPDLFRKETEYRLSLMISSACGAGTCK
jgi:Erv1 / Alr family